jgi:N-acetylglutamate synthase-like GNAT family acetyltransferase
VGRAGAPLFAQPLAAFEREGLKATLARAGLPTDDIDDDDALFWRFERDDVPAGFAGIVVHGTDALLRSLVTLPPQRLQGVGGAMVDKMETEARARGARAIYLLTVDSAAFFEKLGYASVARARVPAAIAATAQFARLAAATVMMKQV